MDKEIGATTLLRRSLFVALLLVGACSAQYVTITGNIQGANGLTAANDTISLTPTQTFFVAGLGLIPPVTSGCATSIDGSVVGLPNPLNPPVVAAVYTGTLPAGLYYLQESWYDALGHVTLVGPEVQIQLTGAGQIQENPPTSGLPATVVGRRVYIGTTSGAETLQGFAVGVATYSQSVPLLNGAALPVANNTSCLVVANDAGWPTGTGYVVTLTTPAGATMPGYPQQWQLLGPGGTVNLSMGLPLYNGRVTYPSPILASPYNHSPQSISGPLNLGLYSFSAGTGLFQKLNSIEFADQFPGTDCGSKINSADAALGANQGDIWVNQNCGMSWTTAVVLGAGHVLRFTQGGTYTSSAGITLQANTLLHGTTDAMAVNTTPNVMLQAANGSNLSALVTVNGAFASIEDMAIDGNKANTSCTSPPCSGIVATSAAARFNMDRVTVGNFHTNGITLNGGSGDKFYKLITYQNSGDGLSCIGTLSSGGDGFLADSEFENNLGNGIELNACPAWRINHNDFGENSQIVSGTCGLNIYANSPLTSNSEIITNNQFGNDYRHDLCITGFNGAVLTSVGSNITNNSFIGSQHLLAGNIYSEINLVDGGLNVIAGNVFEALTINPNAYAVSSTAPNQSQGNLITNNVFEDTNSNPGAPAFGLGRILDATANGITCQTASLTLGTGWGSGPAATVTGNNGTIPSCIYTITSGGGSFGASPTVTYTFPGSLVQAWTSNSPICQLSTVAITGAGGAILFNPTVATALLNTWTAQTSTGAAFTPAASETYKVVVSCSP